MYKIVHSDRKQVIETWVYLFAQQDVNKCNFVSFDLIIISFYMQSLKNEVIAFLFYLFIWQGVTSMIQNHNFKDMDVTIDYIQKLTWCYIQEGFINSS